MPRKRGFDTETALDTSMKLFWSTGYEATSITDLAAAMGINRSSLFAAWDSKEKLYLEVLNRYWDRQVQPTFVPLFGKGDPMAGLMAVLDARAEQLVRAGSPLGCLLVDTLTGCVQHAEIVADGRQKLAEVEGIFQQTLKRLGVGADEVGAGARHLTSVYVGMAVMAKAGAAAEALREVTMGALKAVQVGEPVAQVVLQV